MPKGASQLRQRSCSQRFWLPGCRKLALRDDDNPVWSYSPLGKLILINLTISVNNSLVVHSLVRA